MRKISELLASRPCRNHFVVSPEMPLLDAVDKLASKRLGALMVKDGDELVGVLGDRDVALRVTLAGRDPKGLKVRDVMSPDIAYATPATELRECMDMMTGYFMRVMPVFDQGKLLGFVELHEVSVEVQNFYLNLVALRQVERGRRVVFGAEGLALRAEPGLRFEPTH